MKTLIEGKMVKLSDDLINFRKQLEKKTYYVVNAYGRVSIRDVDRWDADKVCREMIEKEGDKSWKVVDWDEIKVLLN